MKNFLKKNGGGGAKNNGGEVNPYATNVPANDPYMNNNNNNNNPPPPYTSSGSVDRYRQEKTPVPSGGYGNAPPSNDRFGPGSYNNSGGFGQDRYDGGPPPPQQQPGAGGGSRYGSGGYGGFGGSPAPSANRDQLFAGARQADRTSLPSGPGPIGGNSGAMGGNSGGMANNNMGMGMSSSRPPNDWESGRGDSYGSGTAGNYGAYEDRQLTEEEIQEQEVTAAKQEIRFIKQQDVSSTRNALRLAQQAEESGRQTLERLGIQGESIHSTERNLDLASNQNKIAAAKASELKALNRSMFIPAYGSPFHSGKRMAEREQRVMDEARRDREEREALRSQAWGNQSRMTENEKDLQQLAGIQKTSKANLAERAKYQFEADSEDEAMEEEIDQNLDQLHGAAKRLNHLAGAMGREVEVQNKHLDRIGGKVDRVDDEIAVNRSRLDRIK